MSKHRIAVLPGDGIGKEVVPEGVKVLEAAGRKFGIEFKFDEYDWSCENFASTGRLMPEDGIEMIRPTDAIFLGAVGWPTVPDHVSLWDMLIPIRREFEQYVNLRPCRMFPGTTTPLANRGPEDIDFFCRAGKLRRRIFRDWGTALCGHGTRACNARSCIHPKGM